MANSMNITISFESVMLLVELAVIAYLIISLRDLRARLLKTQDKADVAERRANVAEQTTTTLKVQLIALQRGAVMPEFVAQELDVQAVHDFGDNGGVSTYVALVSGTYEMEDLEDLAFRLGVQWDALSGETLSAKARALVTWAVKNAQLSSLKHHVRALDEAPAGGVHHTPKE